METKLKKTRLDKWLWAVRIFKTRTLAANLVKQGKVKVNKTHAKPSTILTIGDVLEVKKGNFLLTFKIEQIIEKRVGAPIAQTCYLDLTPQEEYDKFKNWSLLSGLEFREKGSGRPTKKDRRNIDDLKERVYDFGEDSLEEE
jgi:ribosome-associated heat shock protein Hsp15